MDFVDTNIVILKKKYISTDMCMYVLENNPNGKFWSYFLQVSNFVLHCSTNVRGYLEL